MPKQTKNYLKSVTTNLYIEEVAHFTLLRLTIDTHLIIIPNYHSLSIATTTNIKM